MNNIKIIILFVLSFSFANNIVAQSNEQNPDSKAISKDSVNNIQKIHDSNLAVSAQLLFNGTEGTTRALQLKKDGLLKEHITKVEALLICITGEAFYKDEKGKKITLKAGDYMHIEPMVKHWLKGIEASQLLLLK